MKGKEGTFMPMAKAPCSYCHMYQKSMNDEVEGMYPPIYMIIYPHVKHHCHMMEMKHGHMHQHTKEDIEELCENIYKGCEKEINEHLKHNDDHEHSHDHNHRMAPYGRRGVVGDLVKILVLRELLGRRPHHGHHYPYQHHHGHHPYYGYQPHPYGYRYNYEYSDEDLYY